MPGLAAEEDGAIDPPDRRPGEHGLVVAQAHGDFVGEVFERVAEVKLGRSNAFWTFWRTLLYFLLRQGC